eukprot:CAMPEP_0184992258 /NCGR_PEP_ID=MMETSP1098-20130426/40493_1 /TAXON_ID=89044 /ORGANISM="Spumella elongata, Strain CCAP 955/1" /LENGTH=1255 /DNA_ID=CAMNT_0027517835 /DNA_START=84 /DNA_END=3851 /DNA_ORIENTATION=-
MYSPRSSHAPTSSSTKASIPEGFGVAIPSNPQDLLKFIQQQHKKNLNKVNKQSDIIGRAQKQEQQREIYENKLMEFEDFIFKPEGAERLQRQFEHIRMETEDELSMQIESIERNRKVIDIKEQVRQEVAERKRQEEAEKEARKKAAEERRAAVVERLRKKAEEEERRRLEAEAALLAIHEEGLRKEQQARDRLASDRSTMVLEDDLSHLAEQDHKDKMEKLLYQQREKAKLAEWEKAQQLKDAEEAQARIARMAVLEEKKAKLAELKRLQNLSAGKDESGATSSMANARDEAAKLNKQLRIQNKAKFVTKKIQKSGGGGGGANDAELISDMAGLGVGNAPMDAHKKSSNQSDDTNHGMPHTASAATMSVSVAAPSSATVLTQEEVAYVEQTATIDSEVELKQLLRDLMAEKRALRLEQKQRIAAGGGAQGAAELQNAKNLRKKIADVTAREATVQKRLDKIFAASQNPNLKTEADGADVASKTTATVEKPPLTIGPDSVASETALPRPVSASVDSSKTLFSRADQLIREGAHLVQWLTDKANGKVPGVSESTSGAATKSTQMFSKSFAQSFALGKADEASVQRRAKLLLLEAAQVIKDIDPSRDPGNYAESLTSMCGALKAALAVGSTKTTSTATAANAVVEPMKTNAMKTEVAADAPAKSLGIAEKAVPATTTAPSIHVSASTSNIPTLAGARKEDNLLSSVSVSQLPPQVDSPKKPVTHDKPVAVPTISASLEASAEEKTNEAEETSTTEKEKETEQQEETEAGEDEDAIVFEDIPGWEECLTTTMASAAHHAAFYGYSEVLDCLCKYFDCFVMDNKGRTPLFYAALQNRLNCVATLVALDPQWIDVGDMNGDTSLHAAAIANGVGVLGFLLSCEANPDTANYAGLTPCHLARTREALEALCEAGAQPYCVDTKSRMPLWFACNEGRSDCAEFLCEKTPPQYLLWPDDEGETCLHRAAMSGHAQALEVLCQWLSSVEELAALNKKNYTAAHVASNAAVLKVLYENGANVWMTDPKGRMPIFMASFFGRADCVAFLLDIASSTDDAVAGTGAVSKKAKIDRPEVVSAPDNAGDTALHAACMCGHLQCVSLLLYFTRSVRNKQGLSPDELATRAKHVQIAQLVSLIEAKKNEGLSLLDIFGCEFSMLSAVMLYYGARWSKLYDVNFDTVYYLDRATGVSQWERPDAYDEPAAEESRTDKARAVLHRFYSTYNPEKLSSMNDILFMYKNRFTELFISLADKYSVEDLSMFEGVDLD